MRFTRSHLSFLLPVPALAVGVSLLGIWPGKGSAEAGAILVAAQTRSTVAQATTRTATKSSTPRVAIASVKSSASIGILPEVIQTLNNCGPASVSSVLAYWHVYRTQTQAAAYLRADNSIWGMSPTGLPAYARTLGLRAIVGFGGTERLVKALISNGFPVIVSQYVSSYDLTRHYRPIEAYNDRAQTFVSADPYLGAGHAISYAEFNSIWAESDYRFQVIFPPSRQARLNAVLKSAGWSRARAYAQAVSRQESLVRSNDLYTTGTWLWDNGYIDLAWDEAQVGRYGAARSALASARRIGDSPVLINWVNAEMQRLRKGEIA